MSDELEKETAALRAQVEEKDLTLTALVAACERAVNALGEIEEYLKRIQRLAVLPRVLGPIIDIKNELQSAVRAAREGNSGRTD